MENALIGYSAQAAFLGWILGGAPTDTKPVDDQRIIHLFEGMKSRMGMNEVAISLRQSEKVGVARATGFDVGFGATYQITVSSRKFSVLSDEEISALIAHELFHIKHGDTIRLTFTLFITQLASTSLFVQYVSDFSKIAAVGGSLLGLGITLFGYSPAIEFQAEAATAKVLTEAEIRAYINYHGGGKEDSSNLLHPDSTQVVRMLKRELDSRHYEVTKGM